jgi:AraC-like DNA-binding protein
MITLLADEILQHEYISDDFQGLFIVMSKTMTDSLIPHIPKRLPLFQAVRQNPYLPLSNDNFALLLSYYDMLKNVVDMSDNPHRKDIIQHLMIAFHYHSSSWLHMELQDETISETQNENVKQFLKCVEKYYKSQRQVKFYAEELNLTPKYLSQIVKAETGKSVSGWIEEYVILEAKSLLKSSNFTIQQISNELNFIDQSVFGKYFKRNVGISPKQYRQM